MELNLLTSYSVDTTLCLHPGQVKSSYLHGIKLVDREGNSLPNSVIVNFIKIAQAEVERYFSIKLKKQVYKESKTYFVDDWIRWGHITTSYPVVCADSLVGLYGEKTVVTYPKSWLTTRKTSNGVYNRTINLVPNSGTSGTQPFNFGSSVYPNTLFYGSLGRATLPNYWHINYVTGFDEVPLDLLDLIGKYTCLSILPILSDSTRGSLDPGVSSNSLSLDGLSKSVSSFANSQGGIYGARIKQYSEEIKDKLPQLRDYYCGIPFDVF